MGKQRKANAWLSRTEPQLRSLREQLRQAKLRKKQFEDDIAAGRVKLVDGQLVRIPPKGAI